MQSIKVFPWTEKTYEIQETENYTEVNNFGGMNTFISLPGDEYHLTVVNYEVGNAHIQLGFCDENFEVRSPLSYNVKNYCGSLYFGTGDDTKGHSAAFDPIQRIFWQHGSKTKTENFVLENGDKFICKYQPNKISINITKSKDHAHQFEIDTKTFKKPRPCFSLMGNIVVKLCRNKYKKLTYNKDTLDIGKNNPYLKL